MNEYDIASLQASHAISNLRSELNEVLNDGNFELSDSEIEFLKDSISSQLNDLIDSKLKYE